ncbi:GntR family transcriptional regulator [Ruminococcus sp. OA3]|uniref:GntR family transcriptional regulator n=1 Tax=Ruminococcus sp. OA3 TaxID=2914164 RepID=UPI001F05B1AB|nr:GntR family transcriptional regulator [Ruminococcus sp. OA3]MCH1983030.1 GntR family transcriptional regulator [Ruminococcus sp. OA3]
MYQEPHIYEYLFQSLVLQFECGAFSGGQAFPSQQQLCRQYNVGITTVRKVMKMLNDCGYIQTSSGLPATVIYQAAHEDFISTLASRRSEIADCYQGMKLLLPQLYREGAKLCGKSELKAMQKIVDGITDDMEVSMLYRQANDFLTITLQPFRNQLITDLEIDEENYLHIPYIPADDTDDPFYRSAFHMKNWLQTAHNRIEQKQFNEFYASILRTYHDTGRRVDRYLSILSKHAAEVSLSKKNMLWFRTKGHSELYSRLAMTIMRRILNGEFEGQKYLPSIPGLMEEYGVMKETASRAVKLLNTLGFTRTIDKKGTVIATDDFRSVKGRVDFNEPVIRNRLILFLDALQILALTTRNCVSEFPRVSEEVICEMEKNLNMTDKDQISPQAVQILMNYMIHSAPCHSLQNIYQQLNELLLWGNYLLFADETLYPDTSSVSRTTADIADALRTREQAALPELTERFFSQSYEGIYSLVARLMNGAENLPVFLTRTPVRRS